MSRLVHAVRAAAPSVPGAFDAYVIPDGTAWASASRCSCPFASAALEPNAPHEILIMALREEPQLLALLLEHLAHVSVQPTLHVVDSTVRFADVKEARPDGVVLSEAQRATISKCTDLTTLERWLDAAFAASSNKDVLRAIFRRMTSK